MMNSGQIEKANALANRIGTMIIHNNTESLMDCDPKEPGGAKVMWAKVNEITGKKSRPKASAPEPAILNAHYAATSTDAHYTEPLLKCSCAPLDSWPSEQTVFYALEHLKHEERKRETKSKVNKFSQLEILYK